MNQNRQSEHPAHLIAAVREGDEAAFAALLDLYAPLLTSLASAFRLGGQMRAEELMQEARYALYRAALSYREGGVTFGLYAKICVRNALIAGSRRSSREEHPCSLDDPSLDSGVIGEDSGDVLDALIHAEALEALWKRAARVQSSYEWRVFSAYVGGSSVEEIAAEIGRDAKSVRNALGRALAKLRDASSEG